MGDLPRKAKVVIPLLPLHQINNSTVQTNIKCESSNVRTRDSLSIYCNNISKEKEDVDMDNGNHGRKELRENCENMQNISNAEQAIVGNDDNAKEEQQDEDEDMDGDEDIEHFKQWIPLKDDEYITFKRGEIDEDDGMDEDNLMYIDSFLRGISVSNHGIDANEISISINDDDEDDDQQMIESNQDRDNILEDEQLEKFRRRDLSDYLPQESRSSYREKDWWMKYLRPLER